MKIFHRLLILIVFCLGGAASASAVPTVTLSGSNGVFVVAGSGFQSIGGAKITLNYDTSTLANPRVSKGELGSRAAVWVANTSLPGKVIIAPATLEGFPESGVIATISFDLKGNPPGVIPRVTAMVNRGDRSRDFAARVVNPFATTQTSSDSKAETTDTLAADRADNTDATAPGDATTPAGTADKTRTKETTSTTASTVSSSTGAVGIRGIELVAGGAPAAPAEEDPPASSDGSRNVGALEGITTASEAAAGETASDTATGDSPAVESLPQPRERREAQGREPSRVVYRSVLEAFRSFDGQRTPESLSAIFSAQEATGVRQEPAIALSDGVSRVRLLIALRPAETAPSFSLTDARLVSLKAEPDGKWLLELLPAKGSCQAGVTVIHGEAQTVIPLVVAPPLSPGGGDRITASRFAQFLGDRGTEKTPRFDLNGDGGRDFIDDYIFTANFLAGKGGEAGKASGEPARKK